MATRCNGHNRRGGPCGNWAVPGEAKCKFHGGLTPKGTASPHWKTGLRAKDFSPDLWPYARDVARQPPPGDPLVWLARQKSRLEVLQRFAARQTPVDVAAQVALIDAARKLAATESRIQFLAANTLPRADAMRLGRNWAAVNRELVDGWAADGKLKNPDDFLRQLIDRLRRISMAAGLDPDTHSSNGHGATPATDRPQPEHPDHTVVDPPTRGTR